MKAVYQEFIEVGLEEGLEKGRKTRKRTTRREKASGRQFTKRRD